MDDLSYQEIAAVMNISVSAIESLLFRARTKLKTYKSNED
jgi:DNA-directed RNA polymerase specialized sigma24 family protein